MKCPVCNSSHVIKNGKTHNNKQNHICKDCGKQFGSPKIIMI
jgi:transposase-like protein